MHYAALDSTHYLIRLQKGEEVVAALQKFAKEIELKNASFTALGSLKDPTLAYYHIEEKKFAQTPHTGFYELISMIGTIAQYKEEPMMHAHISISNEQMQTFAGHLVNATVSATVEIILTTFPTAFTKEDDEETGLKLWNLPNQL